MARKVDTTQGFVNICIHAHPTDRSLAKGYSLIAFDYRQFNSRTKRGDYEIPELRAAKEWDFRPEHEVRAAATRKARFLFRKLLGRNPESDELRWSVNRLTFLPKDNLKKAPKTAFVARVWNSVVTGPTEVTFNPIQRQWVGDRNNLEGVVGLGEIIFCGKHPGARFADGNKAEVERWLQGYRAAITATGENHGR